MPTPVHAAPAREPLSPACKQLARIGLGTAALGYLYHPVDDIEALAAIEAAWEAGIRFFDTAHLYGGGLAEQRLGQALCGRPRAQYRVATKIGAFRPFGQGPIPPGSTLRRAADVWDYGFDRTLAAVETSVERLRTDFIDVVHIHGFDRHVDEAVEGAYRALERLKTERVVGAIGGACDTVQPLIEALQRVPLDVVLCAGRFTLMDRAGEGLISLARQAGAHVIVAGVFNSGILATGAVAQAHYNYAAAPDEVVGCVRRLEAVCGRYGVALRTAALQFPLRHGGIDLVLLGPASVAELEDSLARLAEPIPEAAWAELEAATGPRPAMVASQATRP